MTCQVTAQWMHGQHGCCAYCACTLPKFTRVLQIHVSFRESKEAVLILNHVHPRAKVSPFSSLCKSSLEKEQCMFSVPWRTDAKDLLLLETSQGIDHSNGHGSRESGWHSNGDHVQSTQCRVLHWDLQKKMGGYQLQRPPLQITSTRVLHEWSALQAWKEKTNKKEKEVHLHTGGTIPVRCMSVQKQWENKT